MHLRSLEEHGELKSPRLGKNTTETSVQYQQLPHRKRLNTALYQLRGKLLRKRTLCRPEDFSKSSSSCKVKPGKQRKSHPKSFILIKTYLFTLSNYYPLTGIAPGQHRQRDFSESPKCGQYKSRLVLVDTFLGWPGAFPCRTNRVREVVKALLKEVIPRFGTPEGFSSDNGPRFIPEGVQVLPKFLPCKWDLPTPWRPEAGGQSPAGK